MGAGLPDMFPQPSPPPAGDQSFETISVTTPFTPSPAWSHVRGTPFTPPTPTRQPASGSTCDIHLLDSVDDIDSPFFMVPRVNLKKGKGKEVVRGEERRDFNYAE
jgi:hypothetical protein